MLPSNTRNYVIESWSIRHLWNYAPPGKALLRAHLLKTHSFYFVPFLFWFGIETLSWGWSSHGVNVQQRQRCWVMRGTWVSDGTARTAYLWVFHRIKATEHISSCFVYATFVTFSVTSSLYGADQYWWWPGCGRLRKDRNRKWPREACDEATKWNAACPNCNCVQRTRQTPPWLQKAGPGLEVEVIGRALDFQRRTFQSYKATQKSGQKVQTSSYNINKYYGCNVQHDD